ncbi:hypothetical protein QUF80_06175 [Desulfococcaceae bacterium HSG8]|nr:hypothetical protein [Desulfococcaceae bacterium HSG8]
MMEQTITVTIPREWITGLPEEELTYKQIFRLGIRQYKIKRAVQLYRDDVGSPGYISEQIGLPKQDLIRELRLCGIEPDFSEETVQEELAE